MTEEKTIWCHDEKWGTSEYNKRLSKENKLLLKQEEEIEELEQKRDAEIKLKKEEHKQAILDIWKK